MLIKSRLLYKYWYNSKIVSLITKDGINQTDRWEIRKRAANDNNACPR